MKKQKLLDENGEELFEVETSEWFACRGFKHPDEWDWKEIKKEWKKLKMPKDKAYDPFHIPLEYNNRNRCGYYMLISKRGVGKTTAFIILGMILYKLYGIRIQYIRQTNEMLAPKNANRLLETVLSCGYIAKLTEGRWNSAFYYGGEWKFCKVDDFGRIEEKAPIPFIKSLSLDRNQIYKSNYNAPFGDMTIFDEFISARYSPNEFVTYLDLLSTIIRKRSGVINIMLSNGIDEYSEYFDEFEINDEIRKMKKGDARICQTSGSTRVYVELIDHHDKNAARLNREYFGFKNPRLYAITGQGEWAVPVCKHYDYDDETELVDRKHYIKMGLNIVNLEIHISEKYGYIVRVHKATKLYEDSIIYTMDEIEDKRFRKGKGYSKVDAFLWNLLYKDKWHYANNSMKNFVDKYSTLVYNR